MNHTLDVRLVDTHAEGDCATENSNFVSTELFLSECTLFITLACMVGSSRDTLGVEIS